MLCFCLHQALSLIHILSGLSSIPICSTSAYFYFIIVYHISNLKSIGFEIQQKRDEFLRSSLSVSQLILMFFRKESCNRCRISYVSFSVTVEVCLCRKFISIPLCEHSCYMCRISYIKLTVIVCITEYFRYLRCSCRRYSRCGWCLSLIHISICRRPEVRRDEVPCSSLTILYVTATLNSAWIFSLSPSRTAEAMWTA